MSLPCLWRRQTYAFYAAATAVAMTRTMWRKRNMFILVTDVDLLHFSLLLA